MPSSVRNSQCSHYIKWRTEPGRSSWHATCAMCERQLATAVVGLPPRLKGPRHVHQKHHAWRKIHLQGFERPFASPCRCLGHRSSSRPHSGHQVWSDLDMQVQTEPRTGLWWDNSD